MSRVPLSAAARCLIGAGAALVLAAGSPAADTTPAQADAAASSDMPAPAPDMGPEPPERSGYEPPVEVEVIRGFDPPEQPWLAGHRGVDLAAGAGDRIRAAAAGEVAFTGTVADRPVVSIDHADGIRTTYEPVDASVAAGDHVDTGELIGTLADSADHCGEQSCLHWGARIAAEEYLDPLALLRPPVVRLYPLE